MYVVIEGQLQHNDTRIYGLDCLLGNHNGAFKKVVAEFGFCGSGFEKLMHRISAVDGSQTWSDRRETFYQAANRGSDITQSGFFQTSFFTLTDVLNILSQNEFKVVCMAKCSQCEIAWTMEFCPIM